MRPLSVPEDILLTKSSAPFSAAELPLTILDSLRAVLACLTVIERACRIDTEVTTIQMRVAGGAELATIRLADVMRRADAAVSAGRLTRAAWKGTKHHSLLPFQMAPAGREPYTIFDRTGASILIADRGAVPDEEAAANAVLALQACNAQSALLAMLETAVQALRSYEHGNDAPDLAREVADACEAMIAEVQS